MAILAAFLIPSFISSSLESRIKKDTTKFDSVTTAIRMAAAEPEVEKELEKIGDGDDIDIVFSINSDGIIKFADGKIKVAGIDKEVMQSTTLWQNVYQSTDSQYQVANKGIYGQYVVYHLPVKEENKPQQCSYEIVVTLD